MTANELISKLQDLSPEARELQVCTEGCDCWGDADGVKVTANGEEPVVLITRG